MKKIITTILALAIVSNCFGALIHEYAKQANLAGIKNQLIMWTDINLQDSKGKTALHWIAQSKKLSGKSSEFKPNQKNIIILPLLLNQGADPNIKDKDGNTVLHLAVRNLNASTPELIQYNKKYKVDLNIENGEGLKPIDILIEEYKKNTINKLEKGNNRLRLTLIRLLIKYGAIIDKDTRKLAEKKSLKQKIKLWKDEKTPIKKEDFLKRIEFILE